MFHKKQILASISALTMIVGSFASTADALSVTEAVNSVQATPSPSLPNVANPRGNIGYILANIFYGSADGAKNGMIKPQYLDVAGVNTWVSNGSDAYYGGAGSVGIGTSSPNASFKLDVAGSIRAGSGLTVTSGTVALPTGAIDSTEIANGSLLFADWNQNGCTANQVPKWNGSAWACAADAGIGSEADPVWMAASGSYYTKTNLQTSGQASVSWGNLTGVPAATTSVAGIVQLVDGTGSTSTTQAATANIVKQMWDSLVAMIGSKVTSTGTTNYVAKYSASGGIVNSQLYDDGSKIGLGTSTPGEALEVNGNIKLSGATPSYRLTNVADPISNNDAANKMYVDSKVSASGGGSAGTDTYLQNGSYYSEGGDPYFCRLNTLQGTSQRIISVNQNKKCNSTSNLYCNAGSCNADASVLNNVKNQNQLIGARENTSCSISDGQVYCWGYVGNGQKYLDYSMAPTTYSSSHSCAVTGAGEVKCVGDGTYGQLGDGNATTTTTFVSASGISNAVKVYTANSGWSTNYGRTCALLSDGTVKCWGYMVNYGQVNTPQSIPGLTGVVDFSLSQGNDSTAYGHWCAALSNGTVKCGGANNYGQLGDNTTTSISMLSTTTVSGISNAVKIYTSQAGTSTSYAHSCALLSDGTVKCWGYLPVTGQSNVPVTIWSLTGVVDFSMSQSNGWTSDGHWCAVLSNGTVKCGGAGASWQLGDGGGTGYGWWTPVLVSGISNAVKVYTANSGASTNYGRSCALLSDGTVKCWGYLYGNGQTNTPLVISGMSNVVDFSMSPGNGGGNDHWCAVISTGAVMCSGYNQYGQLGNNTATASNWTTPVLVSGLNNAVKIFTSVSAQSTSYGGSCALLSDGQIKCWGHSTGGRFGNGAAGSYQTPVAASSANGIYYSGIGSISVDKTVPELKDGITAATSVAVGAYHSCAVEGGGAKCWGYNAEGQLGNNSNGASTAPVGVFGISTAKQVASGYMHSCVSMNDGTVRCWGLGREGQLGNGAYASANTPVTVTGVSGATEIVAGDYHTCAITGSGSVQCWGLNNKGQLGNNSKTTSNVAVTASGVTNAVRLAAGNDHTCALTASGSVYCWGANDWGQMGNGQYSSLPTLVPTLVSGITNAGRIGAGSNHTCVVLSDNTMKCWGLNGNSQQASTSYFTNNSPVSLLGMSNILNVVGGAGHSCTVSTDLGNVNCFGGNRNGQLGNGGTITASNASLVSYPTDNTSGVTNYTLALCETRDIYTGNLGGVDGANSICATQCGTGYKFAREAELANFNSTAIAANTYWVDRSNNAAMNCQNWTDSTSGYSGAGLKFQLYTGTPNTNIVNTATSTCNLSQQLLCVRGVR